MLISWNQSVTHGSHCLATRARNSWSSQLTTSPIHHWKKFRTLNLRHRTPVCLNSSSFPGNYPHSILGSPAQLSFTSSPPALATSSWLAMASSHNTDWKYQTNIFEPFLCGAWWSNPDQWGQGHVSGRLMGKVFFFFFLISTFNYYFIYFLFLFFWLCWVFVSVQGLPLVAASGGHSSLRCAGFSLSWPLLLQSTGSRCAGSVVVAHGPSCSVARGIFPDQGSNPCPLH